MKLNEDKILIGDSKYDVFDNKNKFDYLEDVKFISKITKEKVTNYSPKIIYYEGEKVCENILFFIEIIYFKNRLEVSFSNLYFYNITLI